MGNSSKFESFKLDRMIEHRKGRSMYPWNFFHKKIDIIHDVLIKTHEKIKKESILEDIRKQQIVSLVTAFEVYMREFFIFYVDTSGIKIDEFLYKTKREYTLKDISQIVGQLKERKIGFGDLLAYGYSFQKLFEIKDAYKMLLGIDIFTDIKKFELTIKSGKKQRLEMDYYKLLQELLDLRHSIVHDINFRRKIPYDTVVELYNNLHAFVDYFDYFMNDFREKHLEKFDKINIEKLSRKS